MPNSRLGWNHFSSTKRAWIVCNIVFCQISNVVDVLFIKRYHKVILPTFTCYPLQENSPSLIVSDLPSNCRAYLQRLTDSQTLLLFELSSCHVTINWLIDWFVEATLASLKPFAWGVQIVSTQRALDVHEASHGCFHGRRHWLSFPYSPRHLVACLKSVRLNNCTKNASWKSLQ